VVIPCREQAEELRACLESVTRSGTPVPCQIIVVDSAADPAVAATVAAFPGAELLRSAVPLAAGAARNLGAGHARGFVLAFIDADCVAEPGWIPAVARVLEDPGVRLAGGSVADLWPARWIASVDNLLQFADFPPSRPPGPARYLPSSNMALRREDFLAVQGFPDTRRLPGEDVSFCEMVRARWPGGLRFEPRMAVKHGGRTTWSQFLRHYHAFGYARAVHRLHLRPWHVSVGRFRASIPLMVAKRLSYLITRSVQYRGWRAFGLVAQLPLVIPGLWAYAIGLSKGCRAQPRADPA
jgi:GT2 family glycosyltransferase